MLGRSTRAALLATALACAAAASCARADEVTVDWGIPYVKASAAWSRGWTGKGIVIAVMDSGVTPVGDFGGRVMSMWDAYHARWMQPGDDNGHGTFVAGLAAAGRNGSGSVGVAPDAYVLPVKLIDASGGLNLGDAALGRAVDIARQQGASVLNNSWNSSITAPELAAAHGYSGAAGYLDASYRNTLRAMQTFVDRGGRLDPKGNPVGGMMVFAAGNDGKPDPGLWGSLPYFKPDLAPGFLVVGAIGKDGAITSWSSRCGISAAYCLVAPGDAVVSTMSNGRLGVGSGTSFAAPMVTGAVAVLWQMWPYLKNGDIKGILLTSADKSGVYANSAVYGQGLLDLDAATRPIGTVTIAGSGGSTPRASLPSARFARTAAAGKDIVVLDSYDRDYAMPVGALVAPAAPTFDPALALSRFGAAGRAVEATEVDGADGSLALFHARAAGFDRQGDGYAVSYHSASAGYAFDAGAGVSPELAMGFSPLGFGWQGLALADRPLTNGYLASIQNAAGGAVTLHAGPLAVSLGAAAGHPAEDGIQGMMGFEPAVADGDRHLQSLVLGRAALSLGYGVTLGAHVGKLDETGTVLGAAQQGDLGLGSNAHTLFFGVSQEVRFGDGFKLFAGYEAGETEVGGTAGALVGVASRIRSDSWRVGVAAQDLLAPRDRAVFALAQPLRVGSGSVRLSLPTSYDGFTGTVGYEAVDASLVPDRRELDLQGGYTFELTDGVDLSLGAMLRLNPDNQAAKPEVVGVGKMGWKF